MDGVMYDVWNVEANYKNTTRMHLSEQKVCLLFMDRAVSQWNTLSTGLSDIFKSADLYLIKSKIVLGIFANSINCISYINQLQH